MANYYSVHRYVCDVIEEMRKCVKHWNRLTSKRHMRALIEEVQTLVNRMESALYDLKDYGKMMEEKSKLKAEIMKLRKEKKNLSGEDSEPESALERVGLI